MDKVNIFKLILGALSAAPGIIDAVKETVKDTNATKRQKALTLTNKGLEVLDAFAPHVRKDATFQELVAKANDAVYEAAKYGQALADTRKVN
jgi:ABC-type enterochelin transport system substrate-binding protein